MVRTFGKREVAGPGVIKTKFIGATRAIRRERIKK